MLEKTEGRIHAIDRLLKELDRLRAGPTPVLVPSITSFPQTQCAPATQAQGEGSWAPQEDLNPPEPNYEENFELLVQPPRNNASGTGSYRQFRGPGSGSRGGYARNRHGPFYPLSYPPLPEGWQIVPVRPPASAPAAPFEQASIPASTPATTSASASSSSSAPAPAPAPAPVPIPATVSTPLHNDPYHSQEPPPPDPSQHPPTHSHSYPQSHEHYDADPSTPPTRHQLVRLQAYDRESSPPSPARGSYTDRAPARPRSHPYLNDDFFPLLRARSDAPVHTCQDDGGRYADDSQDSPLRSDEQRQRRWTSPPMSPSEHAVHNRHRRYHDEYRRQQQPRQDQQRWGRRERSISHTRTESQGEVRRGGPGNDARGGGGGGGRR